MVHRRTRLIAREPLYANGCYDWPKPCPQLSRLYYLNLSEEDDEEGGGDQQHDDESAPTPPTRPTPTQKETMKIALQKAKKRNDINHLSFNLDLLFEDDVRKLVGELLSLNHTSWSVDIEDNCPEGMIRSMDPNQLQLSLSVLQGVRHIVASLEGTTLDSLHLLRYMPVFTQLECFYLHLEDMDKECLEMLVDLPFAPQLAGINFHNTESLERPVFSDNVSRRVRGFELELPGESVVKTESLIEALQALPALRRLDVLVDPNDANSYPVPPQLFYDWLKSPQCKLTQLSFEFVEDATEDPSLIFANLPSMSKLKTITLNSFVFVSFNIDSLLHFLRNSPSLEFVTLEVYVLDRQATRKLLECQLQCRPRLLTIKKSHGTDLDEESNSGTEKFTQIALLYDCLRRYNESSLSQKFPLSAWPMFLGMVGHAVRYPSRETQVVGIDAIFNVLPRLFGDPNWMNGKKKWRKI